jgi:hypothetical protein
VVCVLGQMLAIVPLLILRNLDRPLCRAMGKFVLGCLGDDTQVGHFSGEKTWPVSCS